jgi:hypothetical protein
VAQEPQIRPRSPEPSRVPVRTWPTPNPTDLIFYVERDGNLPANQAPPGAKSWAFDDPYFDRVNYPNHRLVYVSPQSPEQWSRWYYAADRDHQDEYNWQHTVADLGSTKFSSVDRAYVTPRADYDPQAPLIGSVMASVPAGKFSEEYILAYRKEVKIGEPELDSLYVAEQRTFIKRVMTTEVSIRQKTGRGDFDTTTLYYKGEIVLDGITIEDLVDDQINTYWGAQDDGSFRSVNQISENWYAVTLRTFIDLEPEYKDSASRLRPPQFYCPQATNTTTAISITNEGAPTPPTPSLGQEVTVSKVGSVLTVTTTEQTGSPQPLPGLNALDDGYAYPVKRTLIPTSSVPNTRQSVDSGGKITEYQATDPCNSIAEERQLVSPEKEFTKEVGRLAPPKFFELGLVTTEDTVSFSGNGMPDTPSAELKKSTKATVKGKIVHNITKEQADEAIGVRGTTFDERTGATFFDTEELVTQDEVEEAVVDDDGKLITYEGVDANWAIRGTKKIVDTQSRTFNDIVNYEWPPVLLNVTLTEWVARPDPNTGADRGTVIFPDVIIKKGFSGPQLASVTERWQKSPPTVTPPVNMIPKGIIFKSPLFSLDIPPCLHTAQEFHCNIGTQDPDWEMQYYAKYFPATNYPDWPDSIKWTTVRPHRGGYLVTETTLNKPA